MSIKLFLEHTGDAHETFNDSNENLKSEGVFKKAVVTTGTWILYTYAKYNDAQNGGNQSNYKVLKDGQEAYIDSVNGSMYLVENATEGFILFKHGYYGGFRKYFREECSDVNSMFPHGTGAGVSSAINLSHNERFLIYNKINYAGVEATLQRNAWCPLPSQMGLANDSLQSIRKE